MPRLSGWVRSIPYHSDSVETAVAFAEYVFKFILEYALYSSVPVNIGTVPRYVWRSSKELTQIIVPEEKHENHVRVPVSIYLRLFVSGTVCSQTQFSTIYNNVPVDLE